LASSGSAAASIAPWSRAVHDVNQIRAAGVRIAWPIRPAAHSRQRPVPREIQNDLAFDVSGRPQPAQLRAFLKDLVGEPFPFVDTMGEPL
jgi:hypothetical protein